MVTWNVEDNKGMKDEFDDDAMDSLLGITNHIGAPKPVADIFAIGLQRNCWNCATNKLVKIPEAFRSRLLLKGFDYEVIGIQVTRQDKICNCKPEHGTTALFVLAMRGVVQDKQSFRFLKGCADSALANDEKGVAYMRLSLTNGKSVCLATSHLGSHSAAHRRECLKNFLDDADKNVQWYDCDFKFISGDFNTRTSDKEKEKTPEGKAPAFKTQPVVDKKVDAKFLTELKSKDELVGKDSWYTHIYEEKVKEKGKVKDTVNPVNPLNLLAFINVSQKKGTEYQESGLSFAPTFPLDIGGTCSVKFEKASERIQVQRNCYKAERSLHWTDRIIFSGGKILKYDSIPLHKSEHLPVFGKFELEAGPV